MGTLIRLDPRMRPADVVVEQAVETQALMTEMRASLARMWQAAHASQSLALVAECEQLVPDLREVQRHLRRVAGLAEGIGPDGPAAARRAA